MAHHCARHPLGGAQVGPACSSSTPRLSYPGGLGQWPAVGLLIGFAWLELVYVERDSPSKLAALSLGYFVRDGLGGMLLFGVDEVV